MHVDSSVFRRTPTRDIPGITSLSNSSRFPLRSRVSVANPVIFPPGRAKLSTIPVATGSRIVTMTIGIVLVACLAARRVDPVRDDKDIDLELHEFGHKTWDAIPDFLQRSDIQPGCFSPRCNRDLAVPCRNASTLDPGLLGSPLAYHVSYPRNFRRLLRLGGNAKRKEQSA